MIGAFVFLISLIFIVAIGLAIPENPPGNIIPGSNIHDILDLPISEFPVYDIQTWKWIYAIANGVFWALIIWIFFSLAIYLRKRE